MASVATVMASSSEDMKKNTHKEEMLEEEILEWQAVFDETSQAWYWWNTISGETTWDDPNVTEEEKAKAKANAVTADHEASASEELAEDVTETNGEAGVPFTATGDPNYYNSQEYYDWYYAQMVTASAEGDTNITDAPGMGAVVDASVKGTTAAAYAAYAAYMPPLPGAPFASTYFASTTTAGEHFEPGDITLSATFNQKTGRFQPDRTGGESYFNPNAKAERQMAHFFDIDQYQVERNLMKQQEALNPQAKKKLTKKDIDRFKKKNKEKKLRSLLKRFGPDD